MQLKQASNRFESVRISKAHIILVVFFLLAQLGEQVQACSMYKVTVEGKTMVGCNHDAWFTTPKIWFENAKQLNEYGAAFTGAREVYNNRTAPQSGMNEAGLTFSRLVAYYPKQDNPFPHRIKITNEVDYLTDILHTCATVEEVKKHIEQFDHSRFYDQVFIYIDRAGKYLIVEPYKLIEGNDSSYVLANFCPSITKNEQARKQERYRKGEDFLSQHEANTTLSFCRTLSDTMHVSRKRNGDGTLLTSIWDTQNKLVNLYFYHSYDSTIQFNLNEELAKGDHTLAIPGLFPKNADFERLVNYKTPSNTIWLRISLVILAGLLAFCSLVLGTSLMRKARPVAVSLKSVVVMSLLNLILISYIVVLITNKGIFYFDVPYKHYRSSLISISSYTPFLLLLFITPITFYTIKRLKANNTKRWLKAILVSNNLLYLILMIGFAYWGLYSFWN